MSSNKFRLAPGQFVIWGVILLVLWAAFRAGNMIADEGYSQVAIDIAAVLTVIAILTVRRYWWLPVFILGIFDMISAVTGFKMEGTDLMAAFGFACLLAMMSMGQLRGKDARSNLGIFFYLLLGYVLLHAILYGVDNYFNGDTQFKNIAKRYYVVVVPLILIWCMDRYAYAKGLRPTINVMICLTVLFSIVALVVTLLEYDIPVISSDTFCFTWAGMGSAPGYLRWTILPILLLALCMVSATKSTGMKIFYKMAFCLLLPVSFFGGGRIALMMTLLFIAAWLVLRGKWREIFAGGLMVVILGGILLILGHTMDAKQLQSMPQSFQKVQRALSIFLPADQVNDDEILTEGSNQWHEDLARGAWDYANEDMRSLILGHGFKGWDDSIDPNLFTYGAAAYEFAVKMAIRMGQSETMFFSVLPIFGWIGVLLYYGFMIELMRRMLRVRKLCPAGTLGRSLCEFSFCLVFVTLVLSPVGGAIPSYNMIYWMLGFIAAEPYLVKTSPSLKVGRLEGVKV